MPNILKSLFNLFRTYFALLVVFAVFLWSAWVIATYRAQQTPPGSVVIRLGHWQLEASVREGIDEMAREYRKTHPNVIVIQDAIPEGTYGQSSDIEIQANEILRMRETLEKMIAEHSGRSMEDVSRDIERDKILTAEGAVEYGLIDAVLESRKAALI